MAKSLLEKYGPWALITGASSGIGAAFAVELAEQGFDLIIVGRRLSQLQEIADRAKDRFDVQTVIIVADLGEEAGMELVKTTSLGKDVGLFIASAGFGSSGPFLESADRVEAEMLIVNCSASMRLTHELANRMRQRSSSGIILMSSLLAWQGVPGATNYAATKAYVQGFAEGLARELRSEGIDVLASAPGPVLTGFGDRARMNMTMGVTPDVVAVDSLKALGHKTTVIPGTLSKLLTGSLAMLPRGLRVSIMQRVMAGMVNTT